MKIAIFTQPLGANYGGILQAYALQKHLKNIGHDVKTVKLLPLGSKQSFILFLKGVAIRFLANIFKHRNLYLWVNRRRIDASRKNLLSFVQTNLSMTEIIDIPKDLKKIKDMGFDAYIVGSDQVWRKKYSHHIPTFFLEFLNENQNVKKIAYAASFGVDYWQFNDIETKKYSALLRQFDAVSVREHSSIDLCDKFMNVKCDTVVDPTMLLDQSDYRNLISDCSQLKPEDQILVYILNEDEESRNFIESLSRKLELPVKYILPRGKLSQKDVSMEKCTLPPVEELIKLFYNSKLIVTDSFHGTVLSIIFNKNFVTKGNQYRGLTRFKSLLSTFSLNDRYMDSYQLDKALELYNKPINWDRVNEILSQEKQKAFDFINTALKDSKR